MTIIAAVGAKIFSVITGGLADKLVELGKAYFAKEISEEEYRAAVQVETQKAAVAMVESVQATVRSSPVIQRAYALTVYCLIFVLVWYWLGAPAFQVATGATWPEPPISLGWAHGLLGLLLTGSRLVYK